MFTQNQSSDDNIFFAYFNISGSAIVGEGVVLSPATATNPVGTTHTVTATVVNAAGAPIPGKTVTFNVLTGPNAGATGTAVTNASGVATFTYTSNGSSGTDTIQASFINSLQVLTLSNIVSKIWGGPAPSPTPLAVHIPTLGGGGFAMLALLLAVGGLLLVSTMFKR